MVHLCVYVCARKGKEERRKFENDRVAFGNHSPGVHYVLNVAHLSCALDRKMSYILENIDSHPLVQGVGEYRVGMEGDDRK